MSNYYDRDRCPQDHDKDRGKGRGRGVDALLGRMAPTQMGTVFLNGVAVPVFSFSNTNPAAGLAYFTDDAGNVIVLEPEKIDGISFAPADVEEAEEAEEADEE
ncbi:hypothetical protein [Litchfieldia alkalitelluris]|uniref:hypothetical protein n=1 Tax=Litchfieldia alkalitelluris TaxID=304268 RepID=UPI0009965B2D|nr:hypothetical protein [Litchfieldia alkalitelluris]